MPKSKFFRAPDHIVADVRNLVHDRYPDLASVTIGVLMTTAEVKDHGFRVKAKPKINDEVARLQGSPDVTLIIDDREWDQLGLQVADAPTLKLALLDSLLYRLATSEDKNGMLCTDDHDRPVVEERPADFALFGYAEIARRYGRYSPEVIKAKEIREDFGQLLFPEMAEADSDAALARSEDVEAEALRALLAVGHTGDAARAMIAGATRDGRSYPSVAALVDACYEARAEGRDAPAEASSEDAWKLVGIGDLGLHPALMRRFRYFGTAGKLAEGMLDRPDSIEAADWVQLANAILGAGGPELEQGPAPMPTIDFPGTVAEAAAEVAAAVPAAKKAAKVSAAAAKAARKLVADLAAEGMSVDLSAGSTAAKAPRKPKGGAATAATA